MSSFQQVRTLSVQLCRPLEAEDYITQAMPDVSPPKWHLAHTTWLFEGFLLARFKKNFRPFDPAFHFLFNSYYKSLGPHFERTRRGFLSRPGLPTILKYRAAIENQVSALLENSPVSHEPREFAELQAALELGIHHEQQHQELLLTDIKYNLCNNPTRPAFTPRNHPTQPFTPWHWVDFQGGLYSMGADSRGFAYDHERPRHQIFLQDFRLASRLVTNGEFLEFIESGAYSKPRHWLSDAWDTVLQEKWKAPLYWEKQQETWWVATLNGFERVDPNEPVCHVSFYEADAYARWKGARLPSEAEWETAAHTLGPDAIRKGNFLDSGIFRPLASPSLASTKGELQQLFGDLWEWTSSAYLPYPGFLPLEGPAGEYNGKFMSNQMVLKGGSCATPAGHIRTSYRNYFPPKARWQFMGIRLAEDKKNDRS